MTTHTPLNQQEMKVYFAAFYFVNITPRGANIAGALGINTNDLYDKIVNTPTWSEALVFWGYPHPEAKPKGHRKYSKRKRKREKAKSYQHLNTTRTPEERERGSLRSAEDIWKRMIDDGELPGGVA